MSTAIPRDVLTRVKKLALLPEEVKQSRRDVPVTRLTILKSLCEDHEVTDRFVASLARHTRQRVKEKAKGPGYLSMEEWSCQAGMIDRAVTALESYLKQPSEEERSHLWTLFHDLVGEQNEHRTIHGGPVRIIKNNDLLLVEYALRTVLADQASLPVWAYQTAAHYAKRSDARHADDLTPASVPLLQNIVDFWLEEYNLDPAALTAPPAKKARQAEATPAGSGEKKPKKKAQPTPRQGQCLAFIHLYRKLHRQGPDEQDMALYFAVKPVAVRAMLTKLKDLGLVTEKAGNPRSLRVAAPRSAIPALEDVKGPPW